MLGAAPIVGSNERCVTRADAAALALLVALAAALSFGAWRARDRNPDIHDEFAYIFHARLILQGRVAAPAPPLPEFFEATHILVTPRYTSKYLPGHPIALAPFVALGAPWLWPCVAFAATCVALFLALRWSGSSTLGAALGGALFLGSVDGLRFWMTLLSHPTAGLCVAVAIAAAARVKTSAPGWAALLGAAGAYAIWTRPFIGVALIFAAAPAVLLARDRRRHAAFGGALLAGAAVVLLSCKLMTGSFLQTPWGLYARQYMPWDGPGIGKVVAPPPERKLPAHIEPLAQVFRWSRERHTMLRFGMTLSKRVDQAMSYSPSVLLFPFALFAFGAGAAALVALLFALAFFGLQLTFHASLGYYLLELWPALAFLIAAGAERFVRLSAKWPRPVLLASRFALGVAVLHAAAVVVVERGGLGGIGSGGGATYARVERALEPVRRARGLVFLRYPAGWNANVDLTYNEPDLQRAEIVRALDLGPRNDELRRHFPSRPAFLLDLGKLELTRLTPGGG